jgi:lysophospholipase L1-like esterase
VRVLRVAGYNTRWAKLLLPRLFPLPVENSEHRHLFVTCFFGANDASIPGERQHVPLDEFETNLEHIVDHLKQVCVAAANGEKLIRL